MAGPRSLPLGLEPAERGVIRRRRREILKRASRTRPARARALRLPRRATVATPSASSASAARARTTRAGSTSRATMGVSDAIAVAGGQQRGHGLRAHDRLGIRRGADQRVDLRGRQRRRLIVERPLRLGRARAERRLALQRRRCPLPAVPSASCSMNSTALARTSSPCDRSTASRASSGSTVASPEPARYIVSASASDALRRSPSPHH